MKKIFSVSFLLAAALTFTACVQEEDDIFEKSAAERLNEASALYSQRLMASPNGWAIQLYPTNDNEAPYGNGYLVLCRFNNDFSVDVGMRNSLTNNNYREDHSAWQVITDDGPVLSFNTYNSVLHAFSNPEDVPSTGTVDEPNDETGTGIGGDYEFIIVDAPEDASYMMLKGKKRATYNLLTPMEEGVVFEDYLVDVTNFQNTMFPSNSPTYDVLYFGDLVYKMEDANDGIPNIYPFSGDAVVDESFNPFLVTKRGEDYYLRFRDEIKLKDGEEVIQDFKYDTEKDIFESVDNPAYYIDGDSPVRFFNEIVNPEQNSPYRWQWTRTSEMSEDFKNVHNDVNNEFRAVGYNFQNMVLKVTQNKTFLRFGYRSGTSSQVNYVDCYLTPVATDNGVTFTYEGLSDSGFEAVLNAIPSIKTLIDMMSQSFVVTAAETKFNLRKIKLTSTTNSNQWLVMTLY